MTNFLVKLFIRDRNNRAAYGKLAGCVGIICNALLFALKLSAGLISGSVSVIADSVNNLSDASSSIISLLGFKLSERPADAEHPYGHGRYEYLAGFMVALLIMLIGVELLKSGIGRITGPRNVEFNILTAGALIFSIIVKLWMTFFNTRIGKTIKSKTLTATAQDSRNDVITTAAVLLAAVLSRFLSIELDGWMASAVALFILYSGFGLVKSTLDPLLGKMPDPELVDEIHAKILSYPNVLGTHDLMIHDYGPGRQFASVHVEMPAENDIIESHNVIDNIERDFLREKGIHIIVHLDPIPTNRCLETDLRGLISDALVCFDDRITIHDLRVIETDGETHLSFDCVIPSDVNIGEKEIKRFIENNVKSKYPDFICDITIDHSYAAVSH